MRSFPRIALVVAFVLIALLLVVHTRSEGGLPAVYESTKFSKPSFSVPDWIKPSSSQKEQEQEQESQKENTVGQSEKSAQKTDHLEELSKIDASKGPSLMNPTKESGSTGSKEATEWKPEFAFQNDLKDPDPKRDFSAFASYPAHNYDPDSRPAYAYTTFMSTRNPSIHDPYFMAVESLIYRVLWSPKSKSKRYPFIAFVGDFVTEEQRQRLRGAGAIVRELSPVPWNPEAEGIQHRWMDLFAKLNMWNQTDFHRLIFLDADAFPVTNIDEMFELAPLQDCKPELLTKDDYFPDGKSSCSGDASQYIFAGIPHNPENTTHPNINVGSMVITPSVTMHKRLMHNYQKYDRYDVHMAEQAFLNWMFAPDSAFPVTQLERKWGAFFPQPNEQGKLNVVHEKLWMNIWNDNDKASAGHKWLRNLWTDEWKAMVKFYDSEEFVKQRMADKAGKSTSLFGIGTPP
ncbi:hypothetical protein MBLNU457_5246t1 [Dothideomycetes sp. NU457]